MTSRCSFAEVIFRFAEVHDHTFMWLKPMRKLLVSVSVMYFANSLSLGEFRVPLAILGSVRAFWYCIQCLEVVLYYVACMLLELSVFEHSLTNDWAWSASVYIVKDGKGERKRMGFSGSCANATVREGAHAHACPIPQAPFHSPSSSLFITARQNLVVFLKQGSSW